MLAPTSLVPTLLAALSLSPQWSSANPILAADDSGLDEYQNATLVERSCAHPCGWSGQLCCESAAACYTDSSEQAQCSATAAGSGSWSYYTSTFVETDKVTRTEIYSSYLGGATVSAQATGSSISCSTGSGETACGSICCTSQQYCQLDGQCAAIGVSESPGATATGTGASYSAPVRPTSGTLITITATAAATTTVPFETPVATGATAPVTAGESSGGSGLSGGAIAGIVIGTLAGILLLALLCLFCCAKAAFDGILAIFGLGGKKKRRSTEYVEEYHRHSHGGGSRHSGWYGDRPARPPPPKKSGFGMGGLLAGLAGAGALLGLSKKRRETRYDDDKTTTTDVSSYYYSDYTSSSSASSDDRRTRTTRYTHSHR
ncbi:carcinoembryonic antigen-related cell adhesion molecule 1 [Diplodia corticola]|uniref:Carcinoembryonic antigen-related cell adhesion molecule 1 n=1 Tax=Diplodia corticola TaxID=236234 RepID=A0A1J9R534_9PEZI|nr:carcinoembryonic antigen-related cell adhesion molecule 1 [Diplodia corticola]OJD35657.1 carcinoembryonic antigen-related cell adhesion molecule 1 [Diplodia corticola]